MAAPSSDPDPGGGSGDDNEDGIVSYRGATDAAGRPHGRGTAVYGDGSRFEGRFAAGLRSGAAGTMYFPNGDWLRAPWRDGEANGRGTYVAAGGFALEGVFAGGELGGRVVERLPCGAVAFDGAYESSERHGAGEARCSSGTRMRGAWVRGRLHGRGEWWMAPGALPRHRLCGTWRDGELEAARMWCGGSPAAPGAVYRHDPGTEDRISSEPALADPFESLLVRVAPSGIPGAGEGLFAAVDLPPGTVCAVYSGVRVAQAEVDRRAWDLNGNTITLDEEDGTVIDVPPRWASTAAYCASLGHKANHGEPQNAEYAPLSHPRFGDVKCVRTVRDVRAGEEILVSYGYDESEGADDQMPAWYAAALEARRRESRERGDKRRRAKRRRR